MNVGDSVRVRHPLRDFEESPATVIETAPDPDPDDDDDRILLEFPTGERHWYPVVMTTPHDPLADRTIVLNALGHAYRLLRRIENLAWDTHQDLGNMVTVVAADMHDTTYCCLDVNLDHDFCLSPTAGIPR